MGKQHPLCRAKPKLAPKDEVCKLTGKPLIEIENVQATLQITTWSDSALRTWQRENCLSPEKRTACKTYLNNNISTQKTLLKTNDPCYLLCAPSKYLLTENKTSRGEIISRFCQKVQGDEKSKKVEKEKEEKIKKYCEGRIKAAKQGGKNDFMEDRRCANYCPGGYSNGRCWIKKMTQDQKCQAFLMDVQKYGKSAIRTGYSCEHVCNKGDYYLGDDPTTNMSICYKDINVYKAALKDAIKDASNSCDQWGGRGDPCDKKERLKKKLKQLEG